MPDISCVIMARPLRNSLAEHIQFFGRGLRLAEGKTDCIILDHSGNCARFWADCNQVFEHGASMLDDGETREKPAKKPDDQDTSMTCPRCSRIHAAAPTCPGCGFEYPRRAAVEHVPGTLKELLSTGSPTAVAAALWPQICWFARDRDAKRPSAKNDGGNGYALWLYREITGDFPKGQWFDSTVPVQPSPDVAGKIRSIQIRAAHRQKKARVAA